MQFVLNDEIRWVKAMAITKRATLSRLGGPVEAMIGIVAVNIPKKGAALADPRQRSELIDRRN